MKIKLNIGLENNLLTDSDIIQILWLNGFYHMKTKIHTGTYLGNPERTLVIEGKYLRNEEQFTQVIEALCLMLTQECIAAKLNDAGALIYNPKFEGKTFEFNEDYFINY